MLESYEYSPVAFLKNDMVFHVSFDAQNSEPAVGELETKKTACMLGEILG